MDDLIQKVSHYSFIDITQNTSIYKNFINLANTSNLVYFHVTITATIEELHM
jgi:hypothetical protein